MFHVLTFGIALCIASPINAANHPGTLIVGGEEAVKNGFPFLVYFWSVNERLCSGTLIALDLVLTSASCVQNVSEGIYVAAGDHSIVQDDETEQFLLSKQIILHENFNSGGKLNNDIALIKLVDKFNETQAVRPTALPFAGSNPEDSDYGIALGWGSKNASGDADAVTFTLQKANIRILETKVCAALPILQLAEGEFCTFDTKGGLKGDYGGPLICNATTGAVCGIMSRSFTGDGKSDWVAGVYVQVSTYLEWIRTNTLFDPKTTTPTAAGSTSLAAGLTIIILSVWFSLH